MARAEGIDDKAVATGSGVDADASDARLTELLRTSTPTAYPALRELRARHQPAVLRYARLCTASDSSARQLAAQAFTLAARQTARGTEPPVPLRLRLLLLAGKVAASWAADERAAGLDPGLLLVLSASGPQGPVPPMLAAFRALPSRAQGLVWYGVVERQTPERTAVLLGLTPVDVAYETAAALQAMGQVCLRSRLAASPDPRCGNFGRLIEESVRPDSPRDSADLHAHMAHCPHCTAAYEELSALRDAPRATLAEGLLPWAGTAYGTSDAPRPDTPAARAPRPPLRRPTLVALALGLVLTPVLVLLLTHGTHPAAPPRRAAGAVHAPTSAPRVTVTATVSSAPAPSPSRTAGSPSPTHSSAARPPARSPRPSPSPTHAPDGTAAQVVNVATGRCLDIRDGYLENGTDVVTAPCSGALTQRWRVDASRGVVRSAADSGFCLDSRGDVERGVGIWDCGSVDGDHGENLRFTVDDDGVIRPAIAIETAMTPYGGDGVALRPLDGSAAQRWRAGAP
ncbi:ricin-type beta-trefoil lectin domain protein [Streptomyces sediminimaris]|uniref:ricin-type beta-trefoil lectin domain protein n=1 Tax=Streptomyces sediminimaris TaxID=3383721 RepID=UPI00399AED13